MTRFLAGLLLLLIPSLPALVAAQDVERDPLTALWAQDLRLAQVAERIMAANAPLCRQTMPLSGAILHSADQYGRPPEGWFVNGPVAVAQVLPGSPASEAGLRAGDALLAVGQVRVENVSVRPGYPLRDAVFDLVAASSDDLSLRVSRTGQEHRVEFTAPRGCRALVEVLADNGNTARSDGRVIQLSYAFVARLDDAGLAVAFAHELAHAVLEHRRRLGEAGVAQGLGREFGRSRRLSHQAEVEADRLSVHLLANAGYDPAIAPAFWRSAIGGESDSGIFRSRIYPAREERIRLLEEEIAVHVSGSPLPSAAPHLLAGRDGPFSDGWFSDPVPR
jgi:hypothetical protein